MEQTQSLLHTPEGVRDLYGAEYDRVLSVCDTLLSAIRLYGYEPIATPTYEFFDVFSKEVGTTPSRELFKFFDKENNTLVLRPDFTPSIARCAAKYFMEEEQSLRFCYQGSTFTNISALQGKLSEAMEIGAELIGDPTVYGDAEILAMLCDALIRAGLKDFQVTVGNVEYFLGLCEEGGLSSQQTDELRKLIAARDPLAAGEYLESLHVSPKVGDRLLALANSFLDPDFGKDDTDLNERSMAAIRHLQTLKQVLSQYGFGDNISIDLGLMSKHSYYTGIVFRAYTLGVGSPIAKGGRYDSLLKHFGKDAPSIGFVILVDDLMGALHYQKRLPAGKEAPEEILFADHEKGFLEALEKAKKLRSEGKAVRLSVQGKEGRS